MRLSKVEIHNFRNFKLLEVELGDNAVIVGENQAGKSNFLHALRLVLDPTLPDSLRQLRSEDLCDYALTSWSEGTEVSVTVEFVDFTTDVREHAALTDCTVSAAPPTASITYRFYLKDGATKPYKMTDYTWEIFCGRVDNKKYVVSDVRKSIPFEVLPALRDAEADLAGWRNSPLRPLLTAAIESIPEADLSVVTDPMEEVDNGAKSLQPIGDLNTNIQKRLKDMVLDDAGFVTDLGFASTDPKHILRGLRLFVGETTTRSLGENSLGVNNVVYLTLLALAYEQKELAKERVRTIVAIEEPEAHLHPHYQRLVFRDFLTKRAPVFLTTHSPHIVSVSPVSDLVVLRRTEDEGTVARSTVGAQLNARDMDDLARYLDATRGEALFARGILMVEGPAEQFLVPAIAERLNLSLDKHGVSVCSVMGTDFAPYVKFFGPNSLDIPFAVITDGDVHVSTKTKAVKYEGAARASRLLGLIGVDTSKTRKPDAIIRLAETHGIFVGGRTLELDFVAAGYGDEIEMTFADLGARKKRRTIVHGLLATGLSTKKNQELLLKHIEHYGKGRFAQRFAHHVAKSTTPPPKYIEEAIRHIVTAVKRA